MQRQKPVLLPLPRQVDWGADSVRVPAELVIATLAWQQELLPAVLRFRQVIEAEVGVSVQVAASAVGLEDAFHVQVVADESAVSHPQGYRLSVEPKGIRVAAQTAQGAAYGLSTLKQLLAGSGRALPTVQIADWPDFERRGVMLDISRGKVPKMETLYRFVDLLADLKINEFQLYTEHTFAYRNHKEVWQNYSPMTGEEILLLDRYCRERFVDLVPNQNSFGHLKEWLIHERYHHLAEQTTGWTAWGMQFEGPFSLCPVEPATIPFLAELYDELLPHFSSQYFNVGCDETFDVGQGRSKEAVEKLGEHRVYVDQLLRIYDLVKARGKTMQFWGDIIIKAPEFIAELPKDVVALEWGYEANHPFDEHCAHFAKAGIPFYVCPGTSTWNSLVGRTENAIGNLKSAAVAGLKHGAIGYLNTIWGDRGHQDYQPVSYLPIAYGSAVSWAVEANQEVDVTPYLDKHLFKDRASKIGKLLYDLGNTYLEQGTSTFNGTTACYLLHFGPTSKRVGELTEANLDHLAGAIAKVAAGLDEVDLACEDGALVVAELRNAVRMLLHACALGKMGVKQNAGEKPDRAAVMALAKDLDEIMAEHRKLWLARNRIGGLEEMSLVPLRRIREGYKKLLAE
jgi:hexosaminidase